MDRNKDSAEYMMGGGNVSPFPIGIGSKKSVSGSFRIKFEPKHIACSLATTFFSAVTVLGTPGEYYIYGSMFTYFLLTYLFCRRGFKPVSNTGCHIF